jgi:16S rRNA (uracil1498-N3)-methyltransferase
MDCLPLQEEYLMHRFYAECLSENHLFLLDSEDSHHAQRVLRLRTDDQAEVIFEGRRYLSVIAGNTEEHRVALRPIKELPSTEASLSVTLVQGMPKGDKMDLIVQKAVELGAVRIVPVLFERSVVRLSGPDAGKKIQRWQKIAREAGKQSGRCIIPQVCPVIKADQIDSYRSYCDMFVVPWEECTQGGPGSFHRRYPSVSSLGIVIGPEGGISEQEMMHFRELGFEDITLGKRILRTETAGIAAMSVFFGLYGDME